MDFKCKRANIVPLPEGGYYVDALTECGKSMRYTVLGRTPFQIEDKQDAMILAQESEAGIIDDRAWVQIG